MEGGRRTKARHYARDEVASNYDARRFGSRGGAWVDERELSLVVEAMGDLPKSARILDLPVGTGRAMERLLREGFTSVEGADASEAMLSQTRRRVPDAKVSREDAFALSFADASFDAVVCLRFLFHFADVAPLLRELARVLKPGGLLVADALIWSPRAVAAPLQAPFGGPTHTLRPSRAHTVFAAAGFSLSGDERLLLLPSFAYRFVPGPLVGALASAEMALPRGLRSKILYRAVRSER